MTVPAGSERTAHDVSAPLPELDERQRACLASAADRIVPDEGFGGGWRGGAERYVRDELAGDLAPYREALGQLAAELDRAGGEQGSASFAELASPSQDEILAALLPPVGVAPAAPAPGGGVPTAGLDGAGNPYRAGAHSGAEALLRVVMEGYYAHARSGAPAGWRMLGYSPVPTGVVPVELDPVTPISPAQVLASYDTVVIGAGAGGGVVACLLAEAGEQVLLVERGRPYTNAELRGDHLHGKRLGLYDVVAGPGHGHPRVVDAGGGETLLESGDNPYLWGLNAMCIGGGTRLWQGMAWRFSPEDFAMASTYGRPTDSTLADWPFVLDELEPYYRRAEDEIGVCGSPRPRSTRGDAYPMPALGDDAVRLRLGAAAGRLGWEWGPIPFAVNSVPRAGRPACVACPQCQGHACPVDAKNGTQNTVLPRAVATNRCDVLASAQVTRIELGTDGHATGVRLVARGASGETEHAVACRRVVVSAGAVETPRLLLLSGLDNPWIGKNLHSHTIGQRWGLAREPVGDSCWRGPGQSVSIVDFVHGGGAPFGGGLLFDAPAPLPLGAAGLAAVLGRPRWGAGHSRFMREDLGRLLGTMTIGQEIPGHGSAVELDPVVRDRLGLPVARVRIRTTRETADITGFIGTLLDDWLEEAGCSPVVAVMPANRTAWSEHGAGTCRMGDDPAASVTDHLGRVHGTRNLYVCDASLHPTNGSVNPALTVMANAFRIGEHLAGTAGG